MQDIETVLPRSVNLIVEIEMLKIVYLKGLV